MQRQVTQTAYQKLQIINSLVKDELAEETEARRRRYAVLDSNPLSLSTGPRGFHSEPILSL